MDKHFDEFMRFFNMNDKNGCVLYALEGIRSGKFSIPFLYEGILKPALYSIDKCAKNDNDCIWDEHVKSSIARTVVESLYPEIVKKSEKVKKLGITVLLTCPENEHHDMGLRMLSDFFTLEGYTTVYLGSHTPRDQVCRAIFKTSPKYVAISVTDYYLLYEAKKLVDKIRKSYGKNIRILAGGNAFKNNIDAISQIGADLYLESNDDILSLKGEAEDNETGI